MFAALFLSLVDFKTVRAPRSADPSQGDWFMAALEFRARIVTNDRYRERAGDYPEVQRKGFLIPGGLRDGRVWLKGLGPAASEKA
jgi:hypothetical protein